MGELFWSVEVDGKVQEGSVSAQGVVRVRCDAPAGTLGPVVAGVSLPLAADGRVFMNGYQSWSHSREFTKTDVQHGLERLWRHTIKKYALDGYADYHFVNYPGKPGHFHGFSYCYVREGERFRLVGSLDEQPGYTIFYYDAGRGILTIERDCTGMEHKGGSLAAFDLFFAEGTEDEVFDAWFAAMGCTCRTTAKIKGYSSWYNRYQDITAQSVLEDLEGCRTLFAPGDLFQVDDGWEPTVGDWLQADEAKFPEGMASLAERIHEAGFQAGLWLAPFVCETKSAVYREHPDWLLRDKNGQPFCCGSNWSGFYSLDIDNPEVIAYLRKAFKQVVEEWGFDLVKLDFLYGAAPFGTADESRAARMMRAMGLLREWCGDALILGCGVPLMPAFGVVDYCRIGCDVGLDWDDKFIMRGTIRERVSTKNAIDDIIFRRQLNNRAFGSDPDVFFLRTYNIKLTDREKWRLAASCALFGDVFLTSDDPSRYTPAAREVYEELLHLREAKDVQVEVGLFDRPTVSLTLDGQPMRLGL